MRVALATATMAGALASCGFDDSVPGVAENWTLTSINNNSLPYTIPTSSHVVIVTGGTAELSSNNNYSFVYTGTTDGVVGTVASDNGRWAIASSEFTFTSSTLHGEAYSGDLTGPNFTAELLPETFGTTTGAVNVVFTKD